VITGEPVAEVKAALKQNLNHTLFTEGEEPIYGTQY
jgi:hypothetical protein